MERRRIQQCDFCGGFHSEDGCLHWKQIKIKACPTCLAVDHYWTICPQRSNFCRQCKQRGHSRGSCPQARTRNAPPARVRVHAEPERFPSSAGTLKMDQGSNATSTVTFGADRKITIQANTETLASLLASNVISSLLSPGTSSATATSPGVWQRCSTSSVASLLAFGHARDLGTALPTQRTGAMPPTPGIALDESNYLERLDIYHNKLWPTLNEFVCPACGDSVEPFLGVLIKSCKIHKFCRACLRQAAVDSPWLEVDCPLSADCGGTLDEGELRELLSPHPDAYRVYLSKRARHVVENDLAQLQPFLYDSRIMTNLVEFECPICMEPIAPLAGVSTRTCQVHYFCRDCMIGAIRSCDDPRPRCPAVGCDACLPDAEVEELAPEEHRRLLNLGVERAIAAAGRGAFHCMVPDCNGMWFVEGQAEGRIDCPLCGLVNCLTCKVVHRYGQSCDEYRQRLEDTRTREQNAESEIQSQRYIEKMIRDHKGMLCPRCEALVTKMSGCDALVCLSCTMELCWATRGPRWGPKGRGDTTGGCGCRVKGRLCHPRCQNCH